MSRLRDLTDDLRILVPVAIPGKTGALTIAGDPSFERIRQMTRAVVDDPELDMLSAAELRALRTFRITVYRSASASPEVARRQIGAVWRGDAKQALLKLSVGDEMQHALHDLMLGGLG